MLRRRLAASDVLDEGVDTAKTGSLDWDNPKLRTKLGTFGPWRIATD
jgi:hypothetical protein